MGYVNFLECKGKKHLSFGKSFPFYVIKNLFIFPSSTAPTEQRCFDLSTESLPIFLVVSRYAKMILSPLSPVSVGSLLEMKHPQKAEEISIIVYVYLNTCIYCVYIYIHTLSLLLAIQPSHKRPTEHLHPLQRPKNT